MHKNLRWTFLAPRLAVHERIVVVRHFSVFFEISTGGDVAFVVLKYWIKQNTGQDC
jgi:hypothetical protein